MTIYTPIKPTYLYIKQHSITGLKYFGKTTRDPYKYPGSGTHWIRHYKLHGSKFIKTLWVSQLYSDTSISEFALAFSELFDIVNSEEWANLKPENGLDGGKVKGILMSETSKQKMCKPKSESHKQNLRKPKSESHKQNLRKPKSATHIESVSKALTGRNLSPEHIDKLSKSYIIIAPDGSTIIIKNMKRFCRENNLNSGNMFLTARLGGDHNYKGWKCRRI
jgi:hypothetical protein